MTTARLELPFVVMAKPVGPVCNLDCRYCYYLGTTGLYSVPHQFRMQDGLLERYVREYIEASPGPTVAFVWHGGEPTLIGLDFYRRVVELQRRFLPEGWECWNNLQTNGTMLTDEWCDFLASERWDVGLSIDGTREAHDAYRLDRHGEGTYASVLAAAKRLQAHGVQPDLLCTVNAATAADPLGVYRALRAIESGWVQFIPVVRRNEDGTVTDDSVTPEAYGAFLCEIFDEWALHDQGRLQIQFFAEVANMYAGGSPTVCQLAPECGRVLVLEHDGAVYSCDHFVDAAHRLGSLGASGAGAEDATGDLGAMVEAPEQRAFGLDKREGLTAQCRACPWLAVCNGGCPKDRFGVAADGEPGQLYLCGGLRRFYAHAEARLRRIGAGRRRGERPEALMTAFRGEAAERWRGIGRNDPCPCGSGRKAKACHWDRRP